MMAGQGKGGVDEGIGFDQGAVQIDTERVCAGGQERGVVERGNRSGQKRVLPY